MRGFCNRFISPLELRSALFAIKNVIFNGADYVSVVNTIEDTRGDCFFKICHSTTSNVHAVREKNF